MEKNSAFIGKIITFGLTNSQNTMVKGCLPAKGYSLLCTDSATDLIALNATAFIINASKLKPDEVDLLWDYYSEVDGCTDETVLWIGEPLPPKSMKKILKNYESFDSISENLKYLLLAAHKRTKKAHDYSKQLADGLLILSLIRKHPGIRTQELSLRTGLVVRSVQRYISALQATGEWLEYDSSNRGWQLQYGISILFGDELK